MSSEWLMLIVGGAVSFPIGFVTNWLFERFRESRAKAELRRKYERLVGKYVAYGLPDKTEVIDYSKPIGSVQISYEKETVLRLHYQEVEHDNVWQAVVWMETPSSGSMAWRYTRLLGNDEPPENRMGHKQCLVAERPGREGKIRTHFFLIGERPRHENEALEKQD
jgi:hypothetical protein